MQTFIILIVLVVVLGGAYYFLFMRKGGEQNLPGKNKGDQANPSMPKQDDTPYNNQQTNNMPSDENNPITGM